ncbi:TPA: DUF551 domain-containing protein [Citrobacter freundii]
MTTNHPAHGPVSLDRLHQIREILSKAAAQSDGGNLGYAMADAVKVINEVLNSEPVAYIGQRMLEDLADGARGCGRVWSVVTDEISGERRIPLFTATPAQVFPDEMAVSDDMNLYQKSFAQGHNACRAAMLQAGNFQVTTNGWIPVSDRMPDVGDIVLTAINGCINVGEMERSGANYRYFTSAISGRELPATHWMPLPAAPQQEVKNG